MVLREIRSGDRRPHRLVLRDDVADIGELLAGDPGGGSIPIPIGRGVDALDAPVGSIEPPDRSAAVPPIGKGAHVDSVGRIRRDVVGVESGVLTDLTRWHVGGLDWITIEVERAGGDTGFSPHPAGMVAVSTIKGYVPHVVIEIAAGRPSGVGTQQHRLGKPIGSVFVEVVAEEWVDQVGLGGPSPDLVRPSGVGSAAIVVGIMVVDTVAGGHEMERAQRCGTADIKEIGTGNVETHQQLIGRGERKGVGAEIGRWRRAATRGRRVVDTVERKIWGRWKE